MVRPTRESTETASKEYYCPNCNTLTRPEVRKHQYKKHGQWRTGTVSWVCPDCGYSGNSNQWTNWTDTVRYWKRTGKDAKLEEYGID